MPERLRDEGDRRALINGVARMGVAQPVGGHRHIDPRPFWRRHDDVVDAPLRNWKHPLRAWRVAAQVAQSDSEICGDQNVSWLVPLPTMASCASPVSRGMTWPQVRLASSDTRSAPK